MRREVTAISGLSMAISFMASVVLCLQIAHMKSGPEWQISGLTAWIVEFAIFGAAIYAWRRSVTLSGWVLGILVMLFIRLATSTSAAVGLMLMQVSDEINIALGRTSTLGPRICAAAFTIMICYPLRVMLPVRVAAKRDRKRFANSAAAVEANSAAPAEGDPAVVLVGSKETIPVWEIRPRVTGVTRNQDGLPADSGLDGTIDLPLKALLTQVPPELVGEHARDYGESHPVPIPMELIVPQLKEARVLVKLSDLCDWLPPGAMQDLSGRDLESVAGLVMLPLDLIVPQLPPGVLELPPPAPPAWANLDESNSVLFATI